jgi:hypothetical protein
MVAQSKKPDKPFKPRRPRPGSKAETILTLTTTTPATAPQITEKLGINKTYVYDVLERYGLKPNALESFKEQRADIFAAVEQKFIECADSAAVKKMIERRGLTDFGILYDKERIERGLSDNNTRPLVVIQIKGDHTAISVDNPVDNLMGKDIKQIEG